MRTSTITSIFTLFCLQQNLYASAPLDYNRDIKPILAKNCFVCHGPDAAGRATKLRLDRREAVTQAARGKPAAIVSGKPEASELIKRVTSTDENVRMPPPDSGHELLPEQIAKLRQWIADGAEYAEHWSFIPPKLVSIPKQLDRSWDRGPLDRFIAWRLAKEGLSPAPDADRSTLLRRLSLDLRGLPATLDEIDNFRGDTRANAYELCVDRYLNDPAFGERWARMWLDLARYADSAGYGSDPLRVIWRYRDWVVESFNANQPFDQFTRDQLAGDLAPQPSFNQKLATAFHRNTMTNTEGGTDDEEFRVAAVKDRVDTTLQVWMGLTASCAKCHSHKYDPISITEYYKLFAVFNQTADNDQPTEAPTMVAPTELQARKLAEFDRMALEAKRRLSQRMPIIAAKLVILPAIPPPVELIQSYGETARLEKSRPQSATVPVMVELPKDKQRTTHVMHKGNFLTPGDKVSPGFPAAFPPARSNSLPDRLALAEWILQPSNPLTARVAVNRLWAQLFGVGLVETEEDFGTQGELPSHPDLLDWLALEYRRLGWDTKAFLRMIVLSSTYRQSSATSPDSRRKDPKNRLLSHAPRQRLEAEMVRDQALALAGLLSRKLHGPSVFPPQPEGLWQAAFNGQRTWSTSAGEDKYRRGLYVFWRRTIPYPSMATFDAPSRETCSIRRSRTNTPLQVFVTLNDPVYVEAAQGLARRLVAEGGKTTQDRAAYGLRLCLGRPPKPEQVRAIVELVNFNTTHFSIRPADASKLANSELGPTGYGCSTVEMAAWTVVANVLLNLDAVLTKN